MRTCPIIVLINEQKQILKEITRSRQLPHGLVERAQIILLASEGKTNKDISQELQLQEETVGIWRKRWLVAADELTAHHGNPKALRKKIEGLLADAERSGAPAKFTPEQICRIIALACETPPDYLSEWSQTTLAQEAVKRNIVESISPASVGRFLK
jgi:putative transposase